MYLECPFFNRLCSRLHCNLGWWLQCAHCFERYARLVIFFILRCRKVRILKENISPKVPSFGFLMFQRSPTDEKWYEFRYLAGCSWWTSIKSSMKEQKNSEFGSFLSVSNLACKSCEHTIIILPENCTGIAYLCCSCSLVQLAQSNTYWLMTLVYNNGYFHYRKSKDQILASCIVSFVTSDFTPATSSCLIVCCYYWGFFKI